VIVAAAVLCLAAVIIILGVIRRRRQGTEEIPPGAETTQTTFTEAVEELECENPISDELAEAMGSGFENDADERIAI
jgi:hypothetical protein